jgi:hypothetical protein
MKQELLHPGVQKGRDADVRPQSFSVSSQAYDGEDAVIATEKLTHLDISHHFRAKLAKIRHLP